MKGADGGLESRNCGAALDLPQVSTIAFPYGEPMSPTRLLASWRKRWTANTAAFRPRSVR